MTAMLHTIICSVSQNGLNIFRRVAYGYVFLHAHIHNAKIVVFLDAACMGYGV